MTKQQVLWSCVFIAALCAAMLWGGPAAAAITPEGIRQWIDAQGMLLILAWGIFCKYVPAAAPIPNFLITWLGAIGYAIAKLAVPEAHAADAATVGSTGLDIVSAILGGFTNTAWARQAFEGFLRPILEKKLGWKKAMRKKSTESWAPRS